MNFLTSALKTSFWASVKKSHFLAISSWFSRYLGEPALNDVVRGNLIYFIASKDFGLSELIELSELIALRRASDSTKPYQGRKLGTRVSP